MTMLEKAARALDDVQFFSRFNECSAGRVEGFPIEICRYGKGDESEIVVVARFPRDNNVAECLRRIIRVERVRAVLAAIREPDEAMEDAGNAARNARLSLSISTNTVVTWQSMIDAILEGESK